MSSICRASSGVEAGSQRGAITLVCRKTDQRDPRLALADAGNPLSGGVPAAVVDDDDLPGRRRGGSDLARLIDGALDAQLLVVRRQDDG